MNITTYLNLSSNELVFGRREFLLFSPAIAIPCLIILAVASIVGTLGNLLILLAILTTPEMRTVESIFIVNLAMSDMYVTFIADPMSIVAKLEGEEFFDSIPGLCKLIASLCTISCVNSVGSISFMSLNRYFHICHQTQYKKVCTKFKCILGCASLYTVGSTMVLLNLAGIGGHDFDRKSLECIWDRMATYPFTVFFSVTLVWIPVILTGFSYFGIYRTVVMSRNRVQQHNANSTRKDLGKSVGLARTLFIIYAVFSICWIPYAILIVADMYNSFSHEIHLYISMWAHLHPSINWLVFYLTNQRFADALNRIARLDRLFCFCKPKNASRGLEMSTFASTVEQANQFRSH